MPSTQPQLQRVQQAIDQCTAYAAKLKVSIQPDNRVCLCCILVWHFMTV